MKHILLCVLGVVALVASILDVVFSDTEYAFVSSVCSLVTIAAALAAGIIALDMLAELRRKGST